MCVLNQLKKKLQLKKLMQFLNQYKYIVFYHSNQGYMLRYDGLVDGVAGAPGKVLFLVNSSRICQLSKNGQNHSSTVHNLLASIKIKHNPSMCYGQEKGFLREGPSHALPRPAEHAENVPHSMAQPSKAVLSPNKNTSSLNNSIHNANLLALAASGGAMGNIYLVGCESFEQMQKVIKDNNPKSSAKTNFHAICLGAICDNSFKDHLDCQRLSGMHPTIKHAQEKLVRTLGRVQNQLLCVFSRPQNHIQLTLMAASGRQR